MRPAQYIIAMIRRPWRWLFGRHHDDDDVNLPPTNQRTYNSWDCKP